MWGVDPSSGAPQLLEAGYFAKADFGQLYTSFAQKYMKAIRGAGHPDWLCFVELPPADLG